MRFALIEARVRVIGSRRPLTSTSPYDGRLRNGRGQDRYWRGLSYSRQLNRRRQAMKIGMSVGTSPVATVTVYVDPSLGDPALQNAKELLADADRVVAANNAIFGVPGDPVSVIVFALGGQTDGTGGADHDACNYTNGGAIEVCASYGNAARVSALFEAELSECSMGGNLCGQNTGEALSRWCAAIVGNNALADFATAPTWAQKGMPDFVNRTDNTDQNPTSTGCGMAFLSWLQSLGFPLKKIAPAMVKLSTSATLAQLYAILTSALQSDAWLKFLAAAKSLPKIVNDDPFGGANVSRKSKGRSAKARLASRGPERQKFTTDSKSRRAPR